MKILAIDTSTEVLSLAVTEDKTLITELRSNIKRAHAEKLIPSIDWVLGQAHLTVAQIDCLAIAVGPGSFTGLRIGLAAVKGLAFSTGAAVVSVPTLDAFAYQSRFWPGHICPLVKAQADEAYTALYRFEENRLVRRKEFRLITLKDLNQVIEERTLLINIGMKGVSDFIRGEVAEQVTIAPPEFSLSSGYAVALLGYEKATRRELENIDTLEPFYLKDFKAKKKIGL
ncbi:MAG: tRNA (adenosine(37)-N6)-threonylcarbamoyltransferase complex dimerization subunit type 1 TsaB [Candidatus Zhuqueibacterota bacterium]